MILEIGHDMLWGKDLQQLCKANIAMTKDMTSKFSNYGSAIRIISVIFWSGNEVSGEYGVEPLPIWGQRDHHGQGQGQHYVVEQTAEGIGGWSGRSNQRARPSYLRSGNGFHDIYGSPEGLVPCWNCGGQWTPSWRQGSNSGIIFMPSRQSWTETKWLAMSWQHSICCIWLTLFHLNISSHCSKDDGHREKQQCVMSHRKWSTFKSSSCNSWHRCGRRPTSRCLPVCPCQKLWLHKSCVTDPLMPGCRMMTTKKATLGRDAVDVNEYEGPSVGNAKASHAAPADPSAKAPPAEPESPTAASTGAPTRENEFSGTVCPKPAKGHVEKYRIMLDENINSEVVEHCVVDGHSYELITKTWWEMDGADNLRYPDRMDCHKTKVNAVTRGHPGQDTTAFNEEMWMDLDDFFRMFNKMLPKKVNPMSVEELVALLFHDSKCRFEFQCIAGHQKATHKGLAYWPFRIRAVQGHTKRAMDTAAASDAFNAVEIYASSGAAAILRMNAKGKKITTADKCPGVIYHRTTKGNWKGILRDGFVAGGGEPVSSGRAHSYFSEVQVSDKKYVSGLRAERPIEIRVAMCRSQSLSSRHRLMDFWQVTWFLHFSSSRLTILKRRPASIGDMRTRRTLLMAAGEKLGFRNLWSPTRQNLLRELDPHLRPPQLARPLHHWFSQEKWSLRHPMWLKHRVCQAMHTAGCCRPLQKVKLQNHHQLLRVPKLRQRLKVQRHHQRLMLRRHRRKRELLHHLHLKFQRQWQQRLNQQKKMNLQRRKPLSPACPQLCQWHHRLRPSWNLFRKLCLQRLVQKNKKFPLQCLHHQSWLQAQSHWCQKRSFALKAMTNHQRRTSRCWSRLRPNNVNDVSQKPSKDNLNAMSVDWCLKELARPTEPRSLNAAKPHFTSWGPIMTLRESTCRASHSISWSHLDFSEIRPVEVQAPRQICSSVQKAGMKELWALDLTLLQNVSQRTQLLLKVSSMKVRTNMTANATIFCGQHIFRNRTGPKHRSGWEYLSSRSWSTMPWDLFFWTSPAVLTCPVHSSTLINHGFTCTELRSFPRRSTSNTWRGILITICCFHARVSTMWQFTTLRDTWNGSRPKMKILTRRTLRRSANSLREPGSKMNQAKRKAEQTGAFGQGPTKKGTASPVARTPAKVEAASSSASASVWLNNPQSSQQDRPSGTRQDRQYTGERQKWHGRWYQKVIRHGRIEWEQG